MVEVTIPFLGEQIIAEKRKREVYRSLDAFLEESAPRSHDPLFFVLTDLAEAYTLEGMDLVTDADPRLQAVRSRIQLSEDRVPGYIEAKTELEDKFLHELIGLEMGIVMPDQRRGARPRDHAKARVGKELDIRRTLIKLQHRKG